MKAKSAGCSPIQIQVNSLPLGLQRDDSDSLTALMNRYQIQEHSEEYSDDDDDDDECFTPTHDDILAQIKPSKGAIEDATSEILKSGSHNLVQLLNSEENGVIAISDVKVATTGQGKGLFEGNPELGCTMDIPSDLTEVIHSELKKKNLVGQTRVLTMIFACKIVENIKFESIEQEQCGVLEGSDISGISDLSSKYPDGFSMRGKFSFFTAKADPFQIYVKVYSGVIEEAK